MSDPEKASPPEHSSPLHLEAGPYVVRSLIKDVALSAGGDEDDVRITCVEVWGTLILSSFIDINT